MWTQLVGALILMFSSADDRKAFDFCTASIMQWSARYDPIYSTVVPRQWIMGGYDEPHLVELDVTIVYRRAHGAETRHAIIACNVSAAGTVSVKVAMNEKTS